MRNNETLNLKQFAFFFSFFFLDIIGGEREREIEMCVELYRSRTTHLQNNQSINLSLPFLSSSYREQLKKDGLSLEDVYLYLSVLPNLIGEVVVTVRWACVEAFYWCLSEDLLSCRVRVGRCRK